MAVGSTDRLGFFQALADRMVDYIKARKAVALDEVAAEFGLRGAEAVARVQALEADGRLTGVMDERGKVGMQGEGRRPKI